MTTIERLSRILVQRYKLDPARLTPDQQLSALGIDSLGMVEILFFIEEEFSVHLPSEGVTFGTLREAAGYIDELIAKQKAHDQQAQNQKAQKAAPKPAAEQASRPRPASTDPSA